MKKKKMLYDVYLVPKNKQPIKINQEGVGKITARRMVKKQSQSEDFFAGYVQSGKKVTNRSSFRY